MPVTKANLKAFISGCANGDVYRVAHCLTAVGINGFLDLGLKHASRGGHKRVARRLIEHGARNLQDALYQACKYNKLSLVRVLLNYVHSLNGYIDWASLIGEAARVNDLKIFNLLLNYTTSTHRHLSCHNVLWDMAGARADAVHIILKELLDKDTKVLWCEIIRINIIYKCLDVIELLVTSKYIDADDILINKHRSMWYSDLPIKIYKLLFDLGATHYELLRIEDTRDLLNAGMSFQTLMQNCPHMHEELRNLARHRDDCLFGEIDAALQWPKVLTEIVVNFVGY